METSHLYSSLTFLSYATGVIIILVGIMLTKVLFDISKLTSNLNSTMTIVKTELEPTLKNINKSVEIVSGIVIKTDENIKKVKTFFSKTPLILIKTISKISNKASKGFWAGISSAFKMFFKK